MTLAAPLPDPTTLVPIATRGDAESLADHLTQVMDALVHLVEQETDLVRAGRLRDAAQLEDTKTGLARAYVADTMRLKASRGFLTQAAPDTMRKLGQRHDTFRAVLQMNLTVLATAHAVSEGIVRGVSSELARKDAPTTYGATGYASSARPPVQPMALSRVL